MLWWQWVLGGLLLLGTELGFVVADFYLVFIGVSAALVGGLLVVGVPLSASGQWLSFAILAIVSLLFFRAKVYRYFRHAEREVGHSLKGEQFTLPVECQAHSSISVEVKGAYWPVRHKGAASLSAGTQVRVVEMEGLTLLVEAVTDA